MKEKDREQIKQLIREADGRREVIPKQEVKKARGNGHKTNWLQVLKDHLTDLKGADWTDENLKTMDGLIDDILADTIMISGGALPADPTASSLARYIASGGTALGWPLPANMSLIDLIGDFTGAHAGAEQDDNVFASLNLAHTDLDSIISELAKVPKSDAAVSWNAAALQAIEDEAIDALESFNLDHLMEVVMAAALDTIVEDDTVLGFILAKADVSTYDRTTMSLEALQLAIADITLGYQEQIPDVEFDLAAIDDDLTANPPGADEENSVVDIDVVAGSTFVLRSLWVDVTSFGAGTKLTFSLWTLVNAVVTEVDSVDVDVLGIQNLMDLFGLQEVHADGIWITVVTDDLAAPGVSACKGTYRWAKAS